MGFIKHILLVTKIQGVANYIFVDNQGNVIVHNLKDYEQTGKIIAFCGKNALSIGKSRLKYLAFPRKSKEDLFIFPVGKYYLGVIKQKNTTTVKLTNNILDFLNSLPIKRSQ